MTLFSRSVIAAAALAVPVAAQLIWESLGDRTSGHALFAVSQLLGWGLIASIVRRGAARHPGTVATRAGRVGSRILLAGCVLQMLFAIVYGATGVFAGEPLEASFVLFLLGFLAVFVGGLMWGWRLLRGEDSRLAGVGVLATSVLGFLAIAVSHDPWHDVFLLSSYAAWVLVGRGLEAPAEPRRKRSSEVSAESR